MKITAFLKKSSAALLFVLLLFTATAYAAFSSGTRLTNNTKFDLEPRMATENNNLHLLYGQTTALFSESGNLFYRIKTSTGWKAAIRIASNAVPMTAGIGGHSIAAYNGKAHIAYTINDGDSEIYYKTNKSGSWPANPIKITSNSEIEDFQPSITNFGGKLYVVFVRQKGAADAEIFFSQNTNGKWSTPVALTSNSIDDSWPHIVAKGGKIYVTWATMGPVNSSIKYRVLSNGTWSTAKNAIGSKTKFFMAPQITVYNGVPYITYSSLSFEKETFISNICFSYLSSGIWKHKNVTTNTTDTQGDILSTISNFGSKIRVAWTRYSSNGFSDIIFASLNGAADNWTVENITKTATNSEMTPSMIVDKNAKSHIVYSAGNNKTEIYYRREK